MFPSTISMSLETVQLSAVGQNQRGSPFAGLYSTMWHSEGSRSSQPHQLRVLPWSSALTRTVHSPSHTPVHWTSALRTVPELSVVTTTAPLHVSGCASGTAVCGAGASDSLPQAKKVSEVSRAKAARVEISAFIVLSWLRFNYAKKIASHRHPLS